MIIWILWVISSKIGNRDALGLSFLIILFKFIAKGASGFKIYISVKVFSSKYYLSKPVLTTICL